MKFFYSAHQIRTIVELAKQTSLVRANTATLALKTQDGHYIFASEVSSSPHGCISSRVFRFIVFSPFGVSPPSDLPVGFKGEHIDPVTRQYHLGNGYRTYNPVLMRFNSPDSESPFARGGLNAYAFVQNDPINRQDPTGHFFKTLLSPVMKLFTKKVYTGTIVAEFDGATAFLAPPRRDGKIPTLYFSGHSVDGWFTGSADGYHNGQRSRLYRAPDLYWKVEAKIDMRGRPTHFLSCDSIPLAETMSQITGAQSSGYAGTLATDTFKQGQEFKVTKYFSLPFHGMTSTKEKVGNLRSPEKYQRASASSGYFIV